ncbi:MAG: GGDEF domain-containing protein [Geminicoccaceae bacterium]
MPRPGHDLLIRVLPLMLAVGVGLALLTAVVLSHAKRAAAMVSHAEAMALHDPLTALPNRRLFQDRLERALAAIRRDEGRVALLLIDLDWFKDVNDRLGHAAGDDLLREVAGRFLASLRETDTVARIGGDEFAVVQTGLNQPDGASRLADRLIQRLTAPFDLADGSANIGCSIGIAIAPWDGTDATSMLRRADAALYAAKKAGRGRFRWAIETEKGVAALGTMPT